MSIASLRRPKSATNRSVSPRVHPIEGKRYGRNLRFASGYVVNGHAASPAEAQVLVASGVQQGAWVVNGYGIAPVERAAFTAPATKEASGQKCYYVLDVLLCD
jgi:hypothetical protein